MSSAHWITEYERVGSWGQIVSCTCSHCNEPALLKHVIIQNNTVVTYCLSNYCPSCGFKMEDK